MPRPFAVVQDETWTSRRIEAASLAEVSAAIEALAGAHVDASLDVSGLTPDEEAARAGFSFVVTDARGRPLHVGVHAEGWLLFELGPLRIVPGDLDGEAAVAFLCPEWTEFPRSRLCSAARARGILRAWLCGSDLPVRR